MKSWILALWMLLGCFWRLSGAHECEGFRGGGGGATELTLRVMNVKGLGEALREPIDSNRSFPLMSIFSIVFAAFETLQHMLDLDLMCPVKLNVSFVI